MSDNLLIVGVGFMGGSLALSLKSKGYEGRIYGLDVNTQAISKAIDLGVIDEGTTSYEDIKGTPVSVVFMASPVRTFRTIAQELKKVLERDTIVSDLGSVKGKLVSDLEDILGSRFVGGHPIAGTEKSGVEYSVPDLFERKKVILTPTDRTRGKDLKKVRDIWEFVGGRVEIMDPYLHDWVFGAVSHLPHAVAFALIDSLMEMSGEVDLFKYPGGGFRDFTRIAASDPVMWRDIFLENRDNLLKAIDTYVGSLSRLRTLIDRGEEEELTMYLKEAKDRRLKLE